MTQNTSSAYDLSVYQAVPKSRQQPKPQLKVVEKRSAKRTLSFAFTPKVMAAFAIVVTLISLMVYNQVCLNEISGEINAIQSDLTKLESEYTKMSSELDSLVSLQSIAEMAKNDLGMDRLDKYQTEYVNLYGEDRINVTDDTPEGGIIQQATISLRAIIGGLLEYIGFE